MPKREKVQATAPATNGASALTTHHPRVLLHDLGVQYDAFASAGSSSRLILSTRTLRDCLLDPQLVCIEMLDAAWSTTKKNGLASGWINRVLQRITTALTLISLRTFDTPMNLAKTHTPL